jgi:hypothetical protein
MLTDWSCCCRSKALVRVLPVVAPKVSRESILLAASGRNAVDEVRAMD